MEAKDISENVGVFVVVEVGNLLLPGVDIRERSSLEAELRGVQVLMVLFGVRFQNSIPVDKLRSQQLRLLLKLVLGVHSMHWSQYDVEGLSNSLRNISLSI